MVRVQHGWRSRIHMVSNFPRLFTASDEVGTKREPARQTGHLREKVFDRVREAFCALHGHDNMLHFEQDRMFLKCSSCGHESPGWELNERPPVVARTEPRRKPRVQPRLVEDRRIA